MLNYFRGSVKFFSGKPLAMYAFFCNFVREKIPLHGLKKGALGIS